MSINDSTYIILKNRAFYPPQKLLSCLIHNTSVTDYKNRHAISEPLHEEVEFFPPPFDTGLSLPCDLHSPLGH